MNKYDFKNMTSEEIDYFIDNATERENILYTLYLEIPEIVGIHGEGVFDNEPCTSCGYKTLYVGPENNFIEYGRCGYCGTMK